MISYEKALHKLAAFCSKSERCISDIQKKIHIWNLTEEDGKKLIKRLQDEKFLDENRFCKAFVNDKIKYNKWGVHKIKYELKKKHIPDSIIRAALSNIDPVETQQQLKILLINKKKVVKGNTDYEIKQKLIRFALGRGFSMDDIEKILSSI